MTEFSHMMPLIPEHAGRAGSVLWEAASEDTTNLLTGGFVQTAAYRLTVDTLHFEAGVLSRVAEAIPLWAVMDVDITQTLTQRARRIADVRLRLDPTGYRYGQSYVVLRSIRDAPQVRDLIIAYANHQRTLVNQQWYAMDIGRQQAGAAQVNVGQPALPAANPTPAAIGGPDLSSELERLARLRQSGALTEEEFTAAKAKLLG